MEFKEGTTPEGFAIVAEEETSESEADDWVKEWCDRARSLWEETPRSEVSQLRTAEDEAVRKALFQRQKKMEEVLKARLEAEAKAHREAAEAEKERKSEEARLRLSRARLVAYYRTHNPEKEENIDKIMEVYEGRLEVRY
jgi:membrane protein involved in colicin uptake